MVLWTAHGLGAFTAWAVVYGLVNGGVVALLALMLDELFGTAQIGRLMGVAMVFCMTATMIGNNFSAAVFERTGSYDFAWQSYTALMVVTLLPVLWLRRQAARPREAVAALPRRRRRMTAAAGHDGDESAAALLGCGLRLRARRAAGVAAGRDAGPRSSSPRSCRRSATAR